MSGIPAVCIAIPGDELNTPRLQGETGQLRVRTDKRAADLVRALFEEFGLDPGTVLVIQGKKDGSHYSGHVLEEEQALNLLMPIRDLLLLEDL